MWYFYILRSEIDNKLYYGSTNDLKRRFKQHNTGQVTSTASRKPLSRIYYEAYLEQSSARKREHTIKSSRGSRLSLLKRINLGE